MPEAAHNVKIIVGRKGPTTIVLKGEELGAALSSYVKDKITGHGKFTVTAELLCNSPLFGETEFWAEVTVTPRDE
jgi:hypothetical protein